MLILDERSQIESIIETGEKPPKMGMRSLIRYLAMYYYEDYKELPLECYIKNIQGKIKSFSFPLYIYEESRYYRYIFRICSKMKSGTMNQILRDSSPISITNEEIKIVKKAPTDRHQKVLFTLYVLAKKNIPSTGWVNYSIRDIFSYANVHVDKNTQYEIMYDLHRLKLIQINRMIDKQGFKVDYVEGDVAITISEFTCLGNQYLGKFKEGWVDCKICHKMVKIHSRHDHSRKYCKRCAEETDRIKAQIRMSNLRNVRKQESV